MKPVPAPHVSVALQHQRGGIAVAAAVLVVCLLAQVLVWATTHFTDTHVTTLEPAASRDAPVVVDSTNRGEPAPSAPRQDNDPVEPIDANTVPSEASVILPRVSKLAQTAGLLSAFVLVALAWQGVVVAGGARLPGVHGAVAASTWSLVILALCAPNAGLLPVFPASGVFVPYPQLLDQALLVRAGSDRAMSGLTYFGWFLLLPMALVIATSALALRFWMAVDAGIIATNVSQLDEKLEREIRARKLGELASPRAVGALNHAIGEPEPAPKLAAGAESQRPAPADRQVKNKRRPSGDGARPI
ncbi:MAG: hypothetical protein AAGD00_02880 [Planctomycetota bacterium]